MHGAQPPASPSTPLLQSCPHRDHAGPTASPGQPRLTCTSPSTVLAGGPGPSPGCRDELGTQCHQVRAVTGWLPWHKEYQGRHLQALLLQPRAGAHGRQGWRPWEQGQAGREGTPSPFPVYLGRRHFLQPFVCEAAPPAPHPAFLRAAGHGAGGCAPGCVWGCTHGATFPVPHRRLQAGAAMGGARCPRDVVLGSPQPALFPLQCPHGSRSHGVLAWAARAGCVPWVRGLEAGWVQTCSGCTYGVHAGCGATRVPRTPPSWVPQRWARRPRYCCGHSPVRPLKLARLPAPRFYGPICLHRALPPAHKSLGAGRLGGAQCAWP